MTGEKKKLSEFVTLPFISTGEKKRHLARHFTFSAKYEFIFKLSQHNADLTVRPLCRSL